jgi:DNA-binding MarR family transcriptional regulator
MARNQLHQRAEEVRRFNRFYTKQIGVLSEGLLDSPFSLTETRLLYELALRKKSTASELGRDLGLDAGYLSRILRAFKRRGLIARERSVTDGRQSNLWLTRKGQQTFTPLNVRARHEIVKMIGKLSPTDQQRLLTAMETIIGLLDRQPTKDAAQLKLRR